MNKRTAATLAVLVAMILFCGWAHGRLTGRWGYPEITNDRLLRLADFPKSFGDWTMVKEDKLHPTAAKMLECRASVVRTYQHRLTSQVVSMGLLAGPAGPIAVHTPDICYASSSYKLVSEPTVVTIVSGDRSDSYWRTEFRAEDLHQTRLTVYHAWTKDSRWDASANPRLYYAGTPVLAKIQVAGQVRSESDRSDPCYAFLRDVVAANWPPHVN